MDKVPLSTVAVPLVATPLVTDANCEGLDGIPNDTLTELASAPQSMTVDNQSYSERNANDLIMLDQYLRAKKAACAGNAGWGGMRVNRVIPPATTGPNSV